MNHKDISPSQIFATASVLEDCPFVNCAAQNTFVPGIVDLAKRRGVTLLGNDLKTGQTKLKSVLTEYLLATALKPTGIYSANALGNRDGLNLTDGGPLVSKLNSKSAPLENISNSNNILYPGKESIDHTVVISYVKDFGDTKRAFDEYSSRVFMNGQNNMIIYNQCPDTLLAVPIMLDLIILTEFFERVQIKVPDPLSTTTTANSLSLEGPGVFKKFDYSGVVNLFFKNPMSSEGNHGFFHQYRRLINTALMVSGMEPMV